jgi:hypothetical protein
VKEGYRSVDRIGRQNGCSGVPVDGVGLSGDDYHFEAFVCTGASSAEDERDKGESETN